MLRGLDNSILINNSNKQDFVQHEHIELAMLPY